MDTKKLETVCNGCKTPCMSERNPTPTEYSMMACHTLAGNERYAPKLLEKYQNKLFKLLQEVPKQDHADVISIYNMIVWRAITMWKKTASADTYVFAHLRSLRRQYLRSTQWSTAKDQPAPLYIDSIGEEPEYYI